MMPLWIALGMLMLSITPATHQAPPHDSGLAFPCPEEAASQQGPAIGIGRAELPRVRKQVLANPPSAFDDAKVDGRVVVSATVGTDGNLCDVRVIASSPSGVGLEATGIASAKGWRFAPATRDGAPVRAPVTIELTWGPWLEGRHPGSRGRTANAEIKGAEPMLKEPRRGAEDAPRFPPLNN